MMKCAGYTLLELMLAVVISAILIAITYPVYIAHRVHAVRCRAEIALMTVASKMENYYGQNATYVGATMALLHADHVADGLDYHLKITQATDLHYTLEAKPTGFQAEHDQHCEILSLTDKNVRRISGDGNVEECWI